MSADFWLGFAKETPEPLDQIKAGEFTLKLLLTGLFLMALGLGKQPIKIRKRPIEGGKRPIKAIGPFSSTLQWRKTAPLKRPTTLWHEIITKIIPWELFFVIFEAFCTLEISRKYPPFAITYLINSKKLKIGIGIGKWPLINSAELHIGKILSILFWEILGFPWMIHQEFPGKS